MGFQLVPLDRELPTAPINVFASLPQTPSWGLSSVRHRLHNRCVDVEMVFFNQTQYAASAPNIDTLVLIVTFFHLGDT